MNFKTTRKTVTSLMSEALMVPLVSIIKLYWVCILFIVMNIPGIYLKKGKKGGAAPSSIPAIQF